jgi:tRNA 2-thiouridine synthesizing protein E
MVTTTIDTHQIHVDDQGFMTRYDEWTEDLGAALAAQIGITMSPERWKAIRFLRDDFPERGETATLRRVATVGGIPTKQLFDLFPKKPAKKMAYIAGCRSLAAACELNRRPS